MFKHAGLEEALECFGVVGEGASKEESVGKLVAEFFLELGKPVRVGVDSG